MTTLETLARRIATVDELRAVVRTMKGMAAANLRRDEMAAASLRRYRHTIERGWQVLLRLHPDALPAGQPVDGGFVLVVFGSDHGLCGPVNRHVVAHAVATLEQHDHGAMPPIVAAVGTRLHHEFEIAHRRPNEIFGMPSSPEGATPRVEELLVRLEEWRRRGIGRVILVYPRRTRGPAAYEPVDVQLLPLDAGWLRRLSEWSWPTKVIPTAFVPRRELLTALTRETLVAELHAALLETMASISASRLAAMQGAQQRIDTRAEELQRRYHHLRQSIITEELLDVFSGFAALTEHP